MLGDGPAHLSVTGQRVLAGLLATMREFSLLFAPNINSYKRYQPGSFAPTALRWGVDNRTCALRIAGHGEGMRVENRVPGGDVNPYLAIAALVAGALHGIEQELELEEEFRGNAYDDAGAPRVPQSLREAHDLWQLSPVAAAAFGDEVVAHYANMARVELAAFDAAVTDWELRRGFERL
jgi:glutamine synthetase